MQIHEIFRRNTNEGVLKGITTGVQKGAQAVGQAFQNAKPLAGAIASNLGGQILQKAGLPSSTGLKGDTAGFGAARGMAAKVNEPLIKQQAKAAMDKWNKSLASLPGGLTPANKTAMQRGLWREVHNNMLRGKLGNNFKSLPRQVWPEPNVQKEAEEIVSSLEQAFNLIANRMTETTLQDWESLARSAYQAMSLAQFESVRSHQTLSKEEEARRQVEIDKLKAEIVEKERRVEEIKSQIAAGNYTVQTKAIAQNAIKDLDATRAALLDLTMNKAPGQSPGRSPAAPSAAAPAMSFGGEPQDPNDPATARLMAMAKAQGKI
jgi:anti-sigma28 factor (negative regulator of flagellin synthesis)